MDLLTIITILLIISAVFSYINERFIKLPGTIGVASISVAVSIIILIAGKTNEGISAIIIKLAKSIDFSEVLLNVLLGFLLFASALHFDYKRLKEHRLPVFLLSSMGVLISAGVFGGLLFLVTGFLEIRIPLTYCFLFGALISPTDPIAISAILKKSKISPRLHTIISGESLFNDGIGIVLFVLLQDIVSRSGPEVGFSTTLQLFAREVLGGITIGLVLGFIGYRMMKTIKNFQTVLLISIALVFGICVVASKLHSSIPLAAVTAGLIIGNNSMDKHDATNRFLGRIWQLIDEILNTILFVMIGLQLVAMPFLNNYWLIGFVSIIIILIARMVSVTLPAIFILHKINFKNLIILTWAGLRGGISVALALSLPPSPYREIIISSCYFIVIFSIIIQGLTLEKIAK